MIRNRSAFGRSITVMDTVGLERLLADALARVDPEIAVRVGDEGSRPGRFFATIQSVPIEVAEPRLAPAGPGAVGPT